MTVKCLKQKYFVGMDRLVFLSLCRATDASTVVRTALLYGVLRPLPCVICGRKAHAHHWDYAQPLEVIWLCQRHHIAEHRRVGYGHGFIGISEVLRDAIQKARTVIVKAMRLTIGEKQARGTHQGSRDTVRPLAEVRAEITEALDSLEDMRFNLTAAGRAIRSLGVLIDVVSRNNGGQEVRTKKLNPACKLQKDMLGTIKSVKRALVLLREEEQIALRAEKPEKDEFEGLD